MGNPLESNEKNTNFSIMPPQINNNIRRRRRRRIIIRQEEIPRQPPIPPNRIEPPIPPNRIEPPIPPNRINHNNNNHDPNTRKIEIITIIFGVIIFACLALLSDEIHYPDKRFWYNPKNSIEKFHATRTIFIDMRDQHPIDHHNQENNHNYINQKDKYDNASDENHLNSTYEESNSTNDYTPMISPSSLSSSSHLKQIFHTNKIGIIYVVVGVESSGNRWMVSLLLSMGCKGVSDHRQPYDINKSFSIINTYKIKYDGYPPCIAFHRSFPHNGQFIDLQSLGQQISQFNYEPRLVWITRQLNFTIQSQLARNMVKNISQCKQNIINGEKIISKSIDACKDNLSFNSTCQWPWNLRVHYESFSNSTYLINIYKKLGWMNDTFPEEMIPFVNKNIQY